ncbi:MAG: hypothetical protein H7259_06605 [Cytophagales bacterium]|nr:hypothetical protein [Cytophaga sp.]
MKKLILLSILCFCTSYVFSQDRKHLTNIDSLEHQLTGIWKLDKVVDKNGNTVKNIQRPMIGSPLGDTITIIATGPRMTFNADHSYILQFTSNHSDIGTWRLLTPDSLELSWIIVKNTSEFNMMTKAAAMFNKKLTYDRDGNITEASITIIADQQTDRIKIVYETEYIMMYKRTK